MDGKTAHLKAEIDEEIFMQQPEGLEKYIEQGNPLASKFKSDLDQNKLVEFGTSQ